MGLCLCPLQVLKEFFVETFSFILEVEIGLPTLTRVVVHVL